MGARKLSDEERKVAEMISRARLAAGEEEPSVVSHVRSWLASCGFDPKPAVARAREIVAVIAEEIAEGPKRPAAKSGLYEAWRLPGFDSWQEGEISATEARAVGATIKVKGAAREFHVKHEDRWGDDRFPWKLRENQPTGTKGAEDDFVDVSEFSTMTAARAEARMLARGGSR